MKRGAYGDSGNLGYLSRSPSAPAFSSTPSTVGSPFQTSMSQSCSSSALPTPSTTQTAKQSYVDWMLRDQAMWQDLHRFAHKAGVAAGNATAKASSRPAGKAKSKYKYYHKVPYGNRIEPTPGRKRAGDSPFLAGSNVRVELLGKTKSIAQRSHELNLIVAIDPAIKKIRHNLRNAAFYMGERIWDRLFEQYDRDCSGCISFREFRALIRRDGKVSEKHVTDEMLQVIFGSIDVDGSGAIEISEFVDWLEGSETAIWEDYHLNTYKPGLRAERKTQTSPRSPQSKKSSDKVVTDWKDDLILQMSKQVDDLKAQLGEPRDERLSGAKQKEAQAANRSSGTPSLYFCASVTRFQGDSLGLKLKPNLRVESVAWDGIIATWNAANPERCVQPGDRVLEVNGKRDAVHIIEECEKLQHLDIFLERTPAMSSTKDDEDKGSISHPDVAKHMITLAVDVNRSLGEDLGLQLKWPKMQVEKIAWDGLIGAWNMKHSDHAVRIGDQVIEVNGARGGGKILPELKRLKRLHITFARGEICEDSSLEKEDPQVITLESKKEDIIVGRIRRNLKAAAYTSKGLDWTKLFRWADHNKTGLLGYEEFHHLIRVEAKMPAKALSEDQLRELFRQVDKDEVGEVTYLEFLQWLGFDRVEEDTLEVHEQVHPREAAHRRLETTVAEQVMQDIKVILFKVGSDRWPSMFEHYDRSHSGQISFHDFHMLMRKDFKIPENVANEKVLREIFSCLDFDTSGAVAYSEFVSWLTGQSVLEGSCVLSGKVSTGSPI